MSEKNIRAERRRLRKAVGEDAMTLMAAMAGVINDDLRPTIALIAQTIQALSAKVETLEASNAELQQRITVSFDAWQVPPKQPATERV